MDFLLAQTPAPAPELNWQMVLAAILVTLFTAAWDWVRKRFDLTPLTPDQTPAPVPAPVPQPIPQPAPAPTPSPTPILDIVKQLLPVLIPLLVPAIKEAIKTEEPPK